ncbi:hypothetical protein GOBAR_DD16882 [Gossypium barbadense]|nr:hypothetical protein GOBAR_DD16882 [Gossypium barbadense]
MTIIYKRSNLNLEDKFEHGTVITDEPQLISITVYDTDRDRMQNTVAKVVVVRSGISGSVCATTLARDGISVTLFDSARGPGGRMSQRREISEDGKELLFDHGAPYFTVTNPDVLSVVTEWESRGLVAEWKSNFGSFDCLLGTTRQHIYVKCCIVGQRPAPVLILISLFDTLEILKSGERLAASEVGLLATVGVTMVKVLPEAPPFLKTDPVRPEFYRATIRWEANDGSGSAG